MLAQYRRLFADPCFVKLTTAGFAMRLPNSMIALSLVMIITARTGSYKLAGSVAAAYSLTTVATNPLLGRLMDRYGQARIVAPAAAIFGSGLTGLLITAHAHFPPWVFYFWAMVISAGLIPVGPMVRARWTSMLTDRDLLVTAYSWQQVLTELGSILGPISVTILAAAIDPSAGLMACLILYLIGAAVLLSQPFHAVRRKTAVKSGGSPLKVPGIILLFGISFGFGGLMQSLPVASVAFAEEYDSRSSAGLMLALLACSSLFSAVAHGVRKWQIKPLWQLALTLSILTLGIASTLLSTNIVLAMGSLLVAGTAIGPTGITINILAQRLAPTGSMTETLAFTAAGNPLGGAIGVSLTGWWIDTHGPRFSFLIAALCGTGAIAIFAIGARWLMAKTAGDISETEPTETPTSASKGALVAEKEQVTPST